MKKKIISIMLIIGVILSLGTAVYAAIPCPNCESISQVKVRYVGHDVIDTRPCIKGLPYIDNQIQDVQCEYIKCTECGTYITSYVLYDIGSPYWVCNHTASRD